jgi:molybdenum cofactor cytidylyltransferase
LITAVVLAAGLSRRMGRAKLLLDLDGKTIIRRSVEGVLAGGVDAAVVVVPPAPQALEAALQGLPVTLAVNASPESGQSRSIRVGIQALPPGTEAVLIALGDQPSVPVAVVRGLIERWRATGAPIVAPRYREGRGNPVLFSAELAPELLALEGDQGARPIIERDAGRVELLEVDEPMPADVDTPEDIQRLRSIEPQV